MLCFCSAAIPRSSFSLDRHHGQSNTVPRTVPSFIPPTMVNAATDSDKHVARPYKCPYLLCGRAFSRLEHQVRPTFDRAFHISSASPDETHPHSHRGEALCLHLSFLRKALLQIRRIDTPLTHTQQRPPPQPSPFITSPSLKKGCQAQG